MTLYESNLNHYAKAILRIVGFEERDKTIVKVYYRPAKDEIFLSQMAARRRRDPDQNIRSICQKLDGQRGRT